MINVSGKVELHHLWFYCQSKSLNGSLSLLVASSSVASSSLSPTLQSFKSFDVYLVIFRTIYCYRDATLFEGVNGHVLLGRDFLPGLPDPLRKENSSFTCCDSASHIIFQALLHMTVRHCASLKSLLNTTSTGCTILVVSAGTKIGSVLHLFTSTCTSGFLLFSLLGAHPEPASCCHSRQASTDGESRTSSHFHHNKHSL